MLKEPGVSLLPALLSTLLDRQDLTRLQSRGLFDELLGGGGTPAQVGALLIALRMKGETPEEIAGAAEAVRARAVPIHVDAGEPLLDTCGTGGDGAHTFNISTAVALVCAGAGVRVAKHGNRSVSSLCGSADVLAAAGVNVDGGAPVAERCLRELGVGFLFAPSLHPGMGRVAPLRRELGVRTLFNVLGPLSNPAGARRQLLGVYAGTLVPTLAETLRQLGSERALVVHGEDGLDEVTPCGSTRAALLSEGVVRELDLRPEDAGFSPVPPESLRGGDAAHNARLLRSLLDGAKGPLRTAVLLNAAAALWVAGQAGDLKAGVQQAATAMDSGAAKAKLQGLVRLSQERVP